MIILESIPGVGFRSLGGPFMKDEKKTKKDMVDRPSHYRRYGMESIDAMRGTMSPEEFNGVLKG